MIASKNNALIISDIQGDLHGHSNFSDGRLSLEDGIVKALGLGYRYVAITDHSQSLHIANGLTVDSLKSKLKEVERCRSKYPAIKILNGSEVDILPDGTLDYPDWLLSELDIVVASIHIDDASSMRNMTSRIVAACKNKHVDIIGHPTCRLSDSQKNIFFNMNVIAQAAFDAGVALEVNCNKPIIDLGKDDIERAKKYGVKFAINTDFHEIAHMDLMPVGVRAAVDAGLRKDDVINTLSAGDFTKWLKR